MSLESDIAVLRHAALFEDLTTDQLRLLAFGAEHRRLRAGETLFREDARAEAGFLLTSGEVSLFRGRGDRQRAIGRYGAGTLLGEMALLTETRRAGTAIAETDSDVIRITRTLFHRMLEEYPDIAVHLHARIRDQLAEMTRRIAALEDRFSE
ncbi:cyclic nucleotide-binding domain-containing protein [Consotaella aegiceratis]|uniref:cyclic nucleotide-binding domain-containing protein n=1 Tax=Consotaella aegiceratis TaxID=3097961 RepID=UPI002F410570